MTPVRPADGADVKDSYIEAHNERVASRARLLDGPPASKAEILVDLYRDGMIHMFRRPTSWFSR